MGKVHAPLPKIISFWEKQIEASNDLTMALQRQRDGEASHLERLLIFEKNTAEEDNLPLEEGDLNIIMQKHKQGSPFALDVKTAKAKWFKVMRQ